MLCHRVGCGQVATQSCSKCIITKFPPFRTCRKCSENKEIFLFHDQQWHLSLTNSFECISEAIPLIEVRNQEEIQATLLLTPRGRMTLQKMCRNNVHVLVIVGGARSSKSSRLNWLLSYFGELTSESKNKFDVAAGYNVPVTSGLWIWSKLISLSDGSKMMLMDCEGLSRGRDSVTSLLSSLAINISSCVIFNMIGQITNGVLNDCTRLSFHLSQDEKDKKEKRELCMWCNDITSLWKEETGNLKQYLDRTISPTSEFNVLRNFFQISMFTTPRPLDEDLLSYKFKTSSIFSNEMETEIKKLLVKIEQSPIWKGDAILSHIETKMENYLTHQTGLLPSLIQQIHKNQVETEFQTIRNKTKTEIISNKTLIPYLPLTYNMEYSLQQLREKSLKEFLSVTQELKLNPTFIHEYKTKLKEEISILEKEVLKVWQNTLLMKQQEKEEKEKEKRQEELKKLEEQKKEADRKLALQQEQLQEQQERLAMAPYFHLPSSIPFQGCKIAVTSVADNLRTWPSMKVREAKMWSDHSVKAALSHRQGMLMCKYSGWPSSYEQWQQSGGKGNYHWYEFLGVKYLCAVNGDYQGA